MAFQIDTSIPLQANKVQFDPASILMEAQKNGAALEKHRLEMQKLREDYDVAKEKRKQEKAMQMGIASDLAGIQSGSPAQYAPTRFEQTPQRGQMPSGMTGVMMREQGQQMPQPQAFGEEILNGDFRLGGGEVTQEAVAGREPLPIDFLKSAFKQSMLNRDYDNAFKFQKAIQESEKTTNEYYGGLTEGIDPKTGQPVLLAMTKTGAVPSGYAPKVKEKEVKAPITWSVPNGRQETTYGFDASGKPKVLGVKNLDAPKPDRNADHPVYFNTTLTGDDFLRTLSPVDQAHVKALNEGREPFPTAKMMASNPYYERLADAVAQYNPDFDATAFSTRKNANTAFTTGIQGRQLLAFGSAVKHLETLGGLIDALENNDTVQVNRLSNLWQKQTGGNAITNFDAAKGIVAKEIMKSIVAGGGGVEERQELARLMNGAGSPQQLRGVIDTYHELMNAQKENLIIQRDAAGLPRSTLPDYTMHSADDKGGKKEDAHGGGDKDPYKITKDTDPRRARYLMNHKRLVEAKDYEGANMLTDMYNKGAK